MWDTRGRYYECALRLLRGQSGLRLSYKETKFLVNVLNYFIKELSMKSLRTSFLGILTVALLSAGFAQQAAQHLLSADEIKKVTPSEYFFRGQKAPVQVRNSTGLQLASGAVVIAALVDSAGYSTAIQQKYQGLLITEVKLNVGGADLAPGQYGFGFIADNKFVVMDVGNNDVLSAAYQTDQALPRPVPLKLVEADGAYRLYAGRKWVVVRLQ
jgi:hypothetical protein